MDQNEGVKKGGATISFLHLLALLFISLLQVKFLHR